MTQISQNCFTLGYFIEGDRTNQDSYMDILTVFENPPLADGTHSMTINMRDKDSPSELYQIKVLFNSESKDIQAIEYRNYKIYPTYPDISLINRNGVPSITNHGDPLITKTVQLYQAIREEYGRFYEDYTTWESKAGYIYPFYAVLFQSLNQLFS